MIEEQIRDSDFVVVESRPEARDGDRGGVDGARMRRSRFTAADRACARSPRTRPCA
jgi:hypothetical protein